jgi:GT2 family glycosyltransferase
VPRASVVIPTWNGAELLRAALGSLNHQTYRDFEIIVVDNGSRDRTREMLAEEFPGVRCIALPENRGFAVAVNLGIGASAGEYVALLNNDAEAEPDWLGALVDALDRHPEAGSVASKMLDAREPGIIDAAGDTMSLFAWNAGHGERDGPPFAQGREVLSACAGAAGYRRKLFDEIGLLDESYTSWFEDVDLGLRAQLAGFRCWYEPSAVVRHHGSATLGRMSETKTYFTVRNTLKLFFQTMPLRRVLIWGPAMVLWPWFDPVLTGRPLRVTARAWFAFWPMVPQVLRARRRAYRGAREGPTRLLALLESPWSDVRRAVDALWVRVRRSVARLAGAAADRA